MRNQGPRILPAFFLMFQALYFNLRMRLLCLKKETIFPTKPKVRMAGKRNLRSPRPPNAFILYRQHHHPNLSKPRALKLSTMTFLLSLESSGKAESEHVQV